MKDEDRQPATSLRKLSELRNVEFGATRAAQQNDIILLHVDADTWKEGEHHSTAKFWTSIDIQMKNVSVWEVSTPKEAIVLTIQQAAHLRDQLDKCLDGFIFTKKEEK